jgi:hypothetical protein
MDEIILTPEVVEETIAEVQAEDSPVETTESADIQEVTG